jgi:hypothetical protein
VARDQPFVLWPPDLDGELEDREDEEPDRLEEEEAERPDGDDPPDLTAPDERPAEEPPDRGAL